MWSMPLMRPFAIDGAAPSTTTKKIAPSSSLNSRIASGNQATEGIVCNPVIIEPIADRSTRLRATSAPMIVPITRANANPRNPRDSVVAAASMLVPKFSTNESHTRRGPGRTYSGFHPLHTTSCQKSNASVTARNLGHAADQIRAPRVGRVGNAVSR